MRSIRFLLAFVAAIPSMLPAAPVAIVNPSGEINNGVDRASIPHAAFSGWTGPGTAQCIRGGTHGGNGQWRMSINPGGEIRQLTGHVDPERRARSACASMPPPSPGCHPAWSPSFTPKRRPER